MSFFQKIAKEFEDLRVSDKKEEQEPQYGGGHGGGYGDGYGGGHGGGHGDGDYRPEGHRTDSYGGELDGHL